MALFIDMIWVLIHVFSDAAAFVGFNTGYRVSLVLGLCVVLLSSSDSGNSLTSLLVSWSMFPFSYLGHSSRKTHSFYRTGTSPILYNHSKPTIQEGCCWQFFRRCVTLNPIPDPNWSSLISFFRHSCPSARQKKTSLSVSDFTSLLPGIHVSVITVYQKVDSLKGAQTNFWPNRLNNWKCLKMPFFSLKQFRCYVFGLANT